MCKLEKLHFNTALISHYYYFTKEVTIRWKEVKLNLICHLGLGHEVLIELTAHKEKLMREKLVLQDEADPSKTITLHLHARVLGETCYLLCICESWNLVRCCDFLELLMTNADQCPSIFTYTNAHQHWSMPIIADRCPPIPINARGILDLLLIGIDQNWLAMIVIDRHWDQCHNFDQYWSALCNDRGSPDNLKWSWQANVLPYILYPWQMNLVTQKHVQNFVELCDKKKRLVQTTLSADFTETKHVLKLMWLGSGLFLCWKISSPQLNLWLTISGKGKGTPALKNGIRLLGIDVDMDSEAGSDWQGFDWKKYFGGGGRGSFGRDMKNS